MLWGNVSVNVLLALLSDSILAGVSAFLFSTFVITLFAEIIPQAYFSRHSIRVAALLTPMLRFYQILLFPVAKPTALVLDAWCGFVLNGRMETHTMLKLPTIIRSIL
ncbi:MAG: CNNM domain-containing protein [Desulfobacterales bacterium]